jgi:uncharacterized membrane protein YqaE (UPF0057 family)
LDSYSKRGGGGTLAGRVRVLLTMLLSMPGIFLGMYVVKRYWHGQQ